MERAISSMTIQSIDDQLEARLRAHAARVS